MTLGAPFSTLHDLEGLAGRHAIPAGVEAANVSRPGKQNQTAEAKARGAFLQRRPSRPAIRKLLCLIREAILGETIKTCTVYDY